MLVHVNDVVDDRTHKKQKTRLDSSTTQREVKQIWIVFVVPADTPAVISTLQAVPGSASLLGIEPEQFVMKVSFMDIVPLLTEKSQSMSTT